MTLTTKLVAVIAFATLASTGAIRIETSKLVDGSAPQDDYRPSGSASDSIDSYLPYQHQLPLTFQLPVVELNPVPFYVPEPIENLKAPSVNQEPNYYEVPIPSQDLVAPTETKWNPNNDPKLYYEVPAVLTKQDLPTNSYPKKYNKEIHSKNKPYSSQPKQEIVLDAINEKQYELKQKELQKVFQQLAKKENQKLIKSEKVDKNKPIDIFEQDTAESEIENNFHSEAADNTEPSDNHDNVGLSEKLTASLGIPSRSASPHGERLNFHLVGHDGPLSYKWGYDTGKGHNRQFRYEERDNAGAVKGHYGYYDKKGKLQMIHYDADPHKGFHAEGNNGNN